MIPADWLRPDWPADARVGALMTTRAGGVSRGAYAAMNLGAAVGDDPEAVAENRRRLETACGAQPVFLRQVHGPRVVRLESLAPGEPPPEADASVTARPGLACTVLVADCLPVLFAAPEGRAVGAAHAGWRGLAGGVLQVTVREVCELADCEPTEVQAWIGAGIGPEAFEVGADVLQAFEGVAASDAPRFRPKGPAADGSPRWWADLPALAGDVLRGAGVGSVSGGRWCTVAEPSRFFSFRRDRVTGRMGAAVWICG